VAREWERAGKRSASNIVFPTRKFKCKIDTATMVGCSSRLLAVLGLVLSARGVPSGSQCCSSRDSCQIFSQPDDQGSLFDLTSACLTPEAAELPGEDSAGSQYAVNLCPNCTSLCAPSPKDAPQIGAIVRSIGQSCVGGANCDCINPVTGTKVRCTAKCQVLARWPASWTVTPSSSLAGPGQVVASFAPVPLSEEDIILGECQAQTGAVGGVPSFRVTMVVDCDKDTSSSYVSSVVAPNASDPCSLVVTVRSIVGCPILDLNICESHPRPACLSLNVGGVAVWLVFLFITPFVWLWITLGSLYMLCVHGQCVLAPLPRCMAGPLDTCVSTVDGARVRCCLLLCGRLRPRAPPAKVLRKSSSFTPASEESDDTASNLSEPYEPVALEQAVQKRSVAWPRDS
jgi:hypothetical protein